MANQFNVSSASFVTGTPLSQVSGWVVMAMDDLAAQEIEHSAILKYNAGTFEATCLKMFRSRAALWLPGRQEVAIVGDSGECAVIDQNGVDRDEFVTSSERNPRNTGHIRAATVLADEVIAVGMQRQVYRRDALGNWSDMMQGLPDSDPEGVTGFECILALSDEEVYAAGWRGEIWMFEGRTWRRINSPTNKIITGMCLAPSGQIIACGRSGLLISGRLDSWDIVNEGACPTDLWSVNGSTGKVFAAGLRHLFLLKDDGAELLDVDVDAESFGELCSGVNVLWSFGQKDFLAFDGTAWNRIY
jgi:hypothetical protein